MAGRKGRYYPDHVWPAQQAGEPEITPNRPSGAENDPVTDGRDSDVTLVLKGLRRGDFGLLWPPRTENRSVWCVLGLCVTPANPIIPNSNSNEEESSF